MVNIPLFLPLVVPVVLIIMGRCPVREPNGIRKHMESNSVNHFGCSWETPSKIINKCKHFAIIPVAKSPGPSPSELKDHREGYSSSLFSRTGGTTIYRFCVFGISVPMPVLSQSYGDYCLPDTEI